MNNPKLERITVTPVQMLLYQNFAPSVSNIW